MNKIRNRPYFSILLGTFLVYLLLCLFSFFGHPLVQAPQLDARENLELAAHLDDGAALEEPFYRAVLYTWLLSLVEPSGIRPIAGALAGFLLHLVNGFLVYRLSQFFWKHRSCAVFGAGLYLLNPASLFYSTLLLDITLGISFFLAGVYFSLRHKDQVPSLLLGGLCMGLASVTRPHFLPVALLLPIVLVLFPEGRSWKAAFPLVPLVTVFLLQGWANHITAGAFRILPWQGSYNLYAANRAVSNGLYYTQVLDLSGRGDNTNPAKVESITLYAAEHPEEDPPYSIEAMNRHWRDTFVEYALAHPVELAGLWLHKAYAVTNTFEQYNNLTFSFHKARIPPLRYNPLGWGVLFTIGAAGFIHLARIRPRLVIAWALIFLAYSSMLILFYASARFRLPLVPLVAVMAGGAVMLVRDAVREKRVPIPETVAALAAAMLTFSTFGDIRSRDTYVQDRLLMANANADLNRDSKAARWARDVLEELPGRSEAQRIYAISYFNMALTGVPELQSFGDWNAQKKWVLQNPPTDPVQDAVLGVFFWKWGEREKAIHIWQSLKGQNLPGSVLSASCLRVINQVSRQDDLDNGIARVLSP